MADKIQVRRDTSANWASVNPILSQGEPGYDTVLKQFKVGDGTTAWNSLPWAVNGAVIDDGTTASSTTWSSAKISNAITDAVANTQTVAPTLSVASVSGNEGTQSTVTITNYNAGFTYVVTSADPSAFTVSRTGATITITHASVNSNATAVLSVSAQDPTKTNAGITQINVTTYNVDVADTAIQVVDFSASVLANVNFSYSGGLKATADGATYVSTPISQGGGETNWKKFTPKIFLKHKKYSIDAVIGNNLYCSGLVADQLTSTKRMLIDSAGNEFYQSGTITVAQGVAESFTNFGADPGTTSIYGAASLPSHISTSGLRILQAGNLNNTVFQYTLSTAWTIPASLSYTNIDLSSKLSYTTSAMLTSAFFSSGGEYLFVKSLNANDSAYPCITRLTLATPFDASTAVAGSAQKLVLNATIAPVLYGVSDTAMSMSFNGKHIYLWDVSQGGYDQSSRIEHINLSTPWDLSTAAVGDAYNNISGTNYAGSFTTSGGIVSFNISPDGKTAIIFTNYYSGSYNYGRIYRATLSTPFNVSTLSSYAASQSADLGTNFYVYHSTVSFDGKYGYLYSNTNSAIIRLTTNSGNNTWTPPMVIDAAAITTEVGVFSELYDMPSTVPALYVDVDTATGNLDHVTAPQIAASNTPTLYSRDGTYATKTITYTATNCDANCLQFKITADNASAIEKITFDLMKGA